MERYVVYSGELMGFIPETGEELASEISEARVFLNIADAMIIASQAMKEWNAVFKVHKM